MQEAPVSRNLQSGNTDAPSPIGSGQGLGEETGTKRAKIRKASCRRGHRSRTGRRRILLGGEAGKDILGREKNKVIKESLCELSGEEPEFQQTAECKD